MKQKSEVLLIVKQYYTQLIERGDTWDPRLNLCRVFEACYQNGSIDYFDKRWLKELIYQEKIKRRTFYLIDHNDDTEWHKKGDQHRVTGVNHRYKPALYLWHPYRSSARLKWLDKQIKLHS